MLLDRRPPTFLGILPKGVDGTRATLQLMRALVRQYKKHPVVRQTALEATGDLRPKDWTGEIARMHAYVRDRIRYIRDTRGVETVQTPPMTIENAQGDCDDKSVLLATMLESIGHPTRFVAVGYQPVSYSHVFVETRRGNKWIALDATEPVPVGWRPRTPLVTMIAHN